MIATAARALLRARVIGFIDQRPELAPELAILIVGGGGKIFNGDQSPAAAAPSVSSNDPLVRDPAKWPKTAENLNDFRRRSADKSRRTAGVLRLVVGGARSRRVRQAALAQVRDYVPAKCEAARTSLPIRPSKVWHDDIYLAPGGDTWLQNQNQLGSHMSSGWFLRYGDHPSDHDGQFGCAELVTDLPSSTYASVLRRSTSFLPPTLDARRRVAVTTAGSVALRSLHGRTHSMSRHLADGTSVKTRVVPASTRYSYSPKRGSISGLHHGTLRPHASARWE